MEQTSYSTKLPHIRHIYDVAKELDVYVEKRRTGEERSLKTKWDKLNKTLMGGIEPNTILTIGGMSGSGKSALLNMITFDLFDCNQEEDLIVLNFSFEMLSRNQIARKVSSRLKLTTSQIFSAYNPLTEHASTLVRNTAYGLTKLPVYYVDTPSDVETISNTIKYFQDTVAKDKWLIVTLDHALLVKGAQRETIPTLAELMQTFIAAKKVGKTTILLLSQLNREIEKPERRNNALLHYPNRSDLSSYDGLYQGSDYVMVIHRPELLNIPDGMYGIHHLPTKDMIYLHVIKTREGEPRILKFLNDLKHNNLLEPPTDDAQTEIKFKETKTAA